MVFLTLEPYNNIKDYLHPNLHSIIKEHLDKENNYFVFYHITAVIIKIEMKPES